MRGALRNWLSNVVLVKKPNGKWKMWVDFTDEDKACPKNSFQLPHIDLIMDAYFEQNQTRMNQSDKEKM